MSRRGWLHHVEVWRDDATAVEGPWPWLLQQLGYVRTDTWATGCSWSPSEPEGGSSGGSDGGWGAGAYVVLESGADHVRGRSQRLRSGVNHLAFWAGTRAEVDALVAQAPGHGWRLLFAERHPHAGGPGHYAAYLEDEAGFEVELVAEQPPPTPR